MGVISVATAHGVESGSKPDCRQGVDVEAGVEVEAEVEVSRSSEVAKTWAELAYRSE